VTEVKFEGHAIIENITFNMNLWGYRQLKPLATYLTVLKLNRNNNLFNNATEPSLHNHVTDGE
jgi:hypothetical protein